MFLSNQTAVSVIGFLAAPCL